MIKQFNHACILVRGLRKSLRFYEGLLGLKAVREFTTTGYCPETIYNIKGLKITYVKLRAPGDPKNTGMVELHYWLNPRKAPKKGYHHISFTVENLDAEYRRLKRRGVKFISKPVVAPHGKSRLCFCCDPDGNLIEFAEVV